MCIIHIPITYYMYLLFICTMFIPYRGAFGSHVSCVLRRLLRICLYYNIYPQFISCSATVGNPLQHFLSLIPLRRMISKKYSSSSSYSTASTSSTSSAYLEDEGAEGDRGEKKYVESLSVSECGKCKVVEDESKVVEEEGKEEDVCMRDICVVDSTVDGSPAGER